jgi:hypothetical protein
MATRYNPKIVTDGLTALHDAGNTRSYPGSGTAVTDISSGNNNGTMNGVTFSAEGGGSFVFDATTEVIDANITMPQQYTLEFAIYREDYTDSESNNYKFLFHAATANFIIIEEDGNISHRVPGVSNVNFISGNIPVQTWTICAVTYNQSLRSNYVNGILTGSNSVGSGTVINTTEAGLSNSRNFIGKLAYYKMYNRALTASEIAQNYNALKGRFGL